MPEDRLACQDHLDQRLMAGLEQTDFQARKDPRDRLVCLDLQVHLERRDSEAIQALTELQGNQGRQN